MPRSTSEAVPDEEDADEDRDREGDKGGDGGDRKECSGSERAAEDEQCHENTYDRVEPHGVNWGPGVSVDSLDPERKREAIVARIRVRYSRCGDLFVDISQCLKERLMGKYLPCILDPSRRQR